MKQLTHGSLFAGIGGFDEGFRKAGMQIVWQVEIDPFPRAVLRTRFPEAELFSDVRECGQHNLRALGNAVTAKVAQWIGQRIMMAARS